MLIFNIMQDTAVQYFSSIVHIFIGLWGGGPISVELSKLQMCSGRLASIFVGCFSCNVLANASGRAATAAAVAIIAVGFLTK